MIGAYLDLARAHAALLVVSIPFAGAALAAALASVRLSWVIAATAAVLTTGLAFDLCVRIMPINGVTVAREALAIEADSFSAFAVLLMAVITTVVALCMPTFFGRVADRTASVFSPALLLVVCGAWSGAVLSRDFTTLFVFAETGWLASIALMGVSAVRSRGALNGALRMATLGGVAAAFFLLGLAFAERALGNSTISMLANRQIAAPRMAGVGLILMLTALLCKAGFAPFNAWAAAGFGRANGFAVLAVGAVGAPGALFALAHVATAALAAPAVGTGVGLALSVLGVGSAVIGSVQTIGAANIWRLAAYSSAAQIGCIVLAIALGSPAGVEAALVQIVALSASVIALVGAASLAGVDARMTSLDGLGRRAPLAGIVMTAGALSLMGAPLTLSFLGRWRLVEAALGIGWWWVAAAAIVLSLAGSYYGGRIIERIYFRHASQSLTVETVHPAWKFALAPALLTAFILIASAVEPTLLLRAADAAAQAVLDRAQ